MELHKRIRRARALSGLTQQEVADKLGVSKAAVAHWESDDENKRNKPAGDKLERLATITGVSAMWLIMGAGTPHGTLADSKPINYFGPPSPEGGDAPDIVAVTHWNKEARWSGYLFFRRDWLEANVDPAECVTAEVSGNDMAPRIMDGDVVLIDKSKTQAIGRVMAIHVNGHLVLRRVATRWDGSTVIEDGRGHSETVPASELATLKIIGQVIWAGGKIT